MDEANLLSHAARARARAYAPYSHFRVGAALLDQHGRIHYGCNVENSAFSPSNCAERTALFRAIADGLPPRGFAAMAVIADQEEPVSPCGVCRQVLAELCAPDMPVIMGNFHGEHRTMMVSELLPATFRWEHSKGEGSDT